MGRKRRDAERRKDGQPIEVKTPTPKPRNLMERILALPRFGRTLIAAMPALALALLLQPVIDAIYLRLFYTPETALLPAWVNAGFAIAFYFAGWYFLVWNHSEAEKNKHLIQIYFTLCGAVIILASLWLIALTVMALIGLQE